MLDRRINDDRSKPAVVRSSQAAWHSSPADGVLRCMLERIGGEVAWATSIVRYRPGARFDAHEHERCEEFLVL